MKQNEEIKKNILAAQGGDAFAFEKIVEGHYDAMFKMAYKWCGNQNDAQDITQDACLKLARGINSFRHDCAFSSWLYRLVINTAKDWYKAQNRHPKGDEGMDYVAIEGESAEDTHYAKQIWHAVYGLPEGEKEALLLVAAQGLSHKEAAELLNIKESTVSWRIHEARKKLTSLFGKERGHG